MARARLSLSVSVWLVVGLVASAVGGCLGADATRVTDFKCPSRPAFTGEIPDAGPAVASVSAFMERRCGTLDCHGSTFRPMRIFGRLGLRDPAENNVTGGKATTPTELDANYASVCNVEPEKMSQAAADFGQSAEQLLLMEKARGVEGHKGGVVVTPGSAGDDCLLGWLRGDMPAKVATTCQKAIAELQ